MIALVVQEPKKIFENENTLDTSISETNTQIEVPAELE